MKPLTVLPRAVLLSLLVSCGEEEKEAAAPQTQTAQSQTETTPSSGTSQSGGTAPTTEPAAPPSQDVAMSTGCHSTNASNCQLYENLKQSKVDSINSQCTTNLSGTVVSACPAESLVGICRNAKKNITVYYYGTGRRVFTAQSAQSACQSDPDGAWAAA